MWPEDLSSAAFFLCGAGSVSRIADHFAGNSDESDSSRRLLDILIQMGAEGLRRAFWRSITANWLGREAHGATVEGSCNRRRRYGALIDEIPVLAGGFAPFSQGGLEVARCERTAGERVGSASRRLRPTCGKMGAEIEERPMECAFQVAASSLVPNSIRSAITASRWRLRWRRCGRKARR